MPQSAKWGYYQHLSSLDVSTRRDDIGNVPSIVGIAKAQKMLYILSLLLKRQIFLQYPLPHTYLRSMAKIKKTSLQLEVRRSLNVLMQ